jgi:NAD(P)-dependent dehydrogenase (short-subunit alcohol dehydrogenase family)
VLAGVRAPERASELRDAIEQRGDAGGVEIVQIDVDDDASVAEAFRAVAEEHGGLDVLVNNAGVSGSGTVEEMALDEFRRQMETNFFGVLRCTQAALPSMRERGSGTIVQISSLAGRFVRGSMGAYSATKHAVEAMSEALAYEVAPFGIRVVLVEPGVIATPIWTKSTPPPTDTSYAHVNAQTMAYFTRMLRDPAPAEAVADTIVAAITSGEPRLRWPVGWDAEALIAKRPQVSDEALLAMSVLPPDEWKAEFARLLDVSLD